jgi:hypothetical protein
MRRPAALRRGAFHVEGPGGGGARLGEPAANVLPALFAQWPADAAGGDPGGVDLLAAQRLDDLLAELPQADAGAGQLRVGGGEAEDVAPLGRAVEAEQQIGSAQVEEAQGVGLGDLPEVEQAAELLGGGRDGDGEDGIARLDGGDEVADGADAADAGGDAGHLVEGPALAELLEAAELGDVEAGVGHRAGVVEVDGDLGVAFDACYRVDDDAFAHAPTFFRSHSQPGDELAETNFLAASAWGFVS